MLRFSPFGKLNWPLFHCKTPLWWVRWAKNHGMSRLGSHSDGYWVPSLKYWALTGIISRNICLLGINGLIFVSEGDDNLQYIGDGGVQTSRVMLINWIDDICYSRVLVLSCTAIGIKTNCLKIVSLGTLLQSSLVALWLRPQKKIEIQVDHPCWDNDTRFRGTTKVFLTSSCLEYSMLKLPLVVLVRRLLIEKRLQPCRLYFF